MMIDPNTPNQIAAEYESELATLRQQLAEAQRAMFYRTPASLISSQATTQQIKMLMEDAR